MVCRGRDGVTPSVTRFGVGCVEEMADQFSRDGRDLNGSRNRQALPGMGSGLGHDAETVGAGEIAEGVSEAEHVGAASG